MPDPFALFEIEPGFDLDLQQLEARFLSLSVQNHPDRFLDPIQQADAADQMARITVAYQQLADPEARANTLLKFLGGPSKEDDKTLPPDLLMQMMDVREDLEAAAASQDKAKLTQLRDWADTQRLEHIDRLSGLFAGIFDTGTAKLIRIELNALRYIARMLEQMPAH